MPPVTRPVVAVLPTRRGLFRLRNLSGTLLQEYAFTPQGDGAVAQIGHGLQLDISSSLVITFQVPRGRLASLVARTKVS